jgi:hypothetical protein
MHPINYENSWPLIVQCPSQPNGNRHTYTAGLTLSTAGYPYRSGVSWYVAYTSSNASSAKYFDEGPATAGVYSSFPNNTELLRGYSFHTAYAALFGRGTY